MTWEVVGDGDVGLGCKSYVGVSGEAREAMRARGYPVRDVTPCDPGEFVARNR